MMVWKGELPYSVFGMFVVSLLNVVSKLNDDTLGGLPTPLFTVGRSSIHLSIYETQQQKSWRFWLFFRFIFTQRIVEIHVFCCNICD